MRSPAKILAGVILAAAIFFAGYVANRPAAPASHTASTRQVASYTCPMHPQYVADHPGDCPMCGMRLVPVTAAGGGPAAPAAPDASRLVEVGGASQQLIGVRTEEVDRESLSHVLRVPGRIAVDEQRLYRIIAAVDGWILDLQENTVGRPVRKNQLLASYYTRELLATERLFLLSIPANQPLETTTKDFSQASIRTSGSANPQFPIDSLRGLGMNDLQIEEIHRTRTASPHVNVYSPVSGFVLSRNITPRQRFDQGTELYRIADLSRVWVQTDIFEKDRQFLKPGAEATVVYQGRRLKARMSDALPQFDAESRTLKTRFELENPDYVLQPNMFVDVEVTMEMPPAITVPADAVFDSGLRKTVFVDRGSGKFEARRVETGFRMGDRIEITRGLMEGERVAAAANFLLDSESRMKAATAGVFNPESDLVCGMEVDGRKAAGARLTATHQGRTYYFCSDQCKKSFEADPVHYLEHWHDKPGSAATPAPRATASKIPAATKAAAPAPAKDGMEGTGMGGGTAAQAGQGLMKDPVCGMDVDPKEPAVAHRKIEHGGKAYYFCSDDCRIKFASNPATYVNK